MNRRIRLFLAALLAAAVMAASATAAVSSELPKTMAVTAYDVGSGGYSQAIAVGAAFKNNLGVTMRILPGKNDVSRMVPLREDKVDFSFNGIGTYLGQEAVDIFATRDWGPQETRILVMAVADNCTGQFVAADTGVKTLADLKGKRVAFVKGSAALNINTLSHLRFGNLTWDDVQAVEVGGNAAAFDAVLNNQADSFFTTTTAGNVLKIQNSPRGLVFPPLPHDDEAGWSRLKEVAPYMFKHMCTESAGNLPPWEGAIYPYPVVMSYADDDAGKAYAMTKAMFEQYPHYKDAAPSANGYALDKQILNWVVPFHEGAIRYYKEVGKWTPEIQAHNDGLVRRQQVLRDLWKEFLGSNPPSDHKAFGEAWMAKRYAGMKQAGLNPVWERFE